MDWILAAASVLDVLSRDHMEAEDAPEERTAPPAPQPALPPAPGSARFDINAPLRVLGTLKGRYITKEGRLYSRSARPENALGGSGALQLHVYFNAFTPVWT